MQIRLFVKFEVKPEKLDAFLQAMQVGKSVLKDAPGCEGVELIQCENNPCIVMLSELWESKEIHDRYAEQMGEANALADFLVSGPEPHVFYIK